LDRFKIDCFREIGKASTVLIQQSGELDRGAWTGGLSNGGQSFTNAGVVCYGADIGCNPVTQRVRHSAFAEKSYHAVHPELRVASFGYGWHFGGDRHPNVARNGNEPRSA
jgi:hypothetical protein